MGGDGHQMLRAPRAATRLVRLPERRTSGPTYSRHANTVVWAVYGLMGIYLLAYLTSLIIQGAGQWPIFNDWAVAGFEVVASTLCIARGVARKSGRVVALTLGFGLLLWSLGDLVLTAESQGGATAPTPSLADIFYLGFFPLTYVAFVIFMRGEVKRLATPSWLDGAVAGVGAAAVCAAFVFPRVLGLAGESAIGTVTNLAYPVADLLLLSLVVGGSTLMSGRRKTPWILMAGGITINVVGDSANLFATSWGRQGLILNAIAWPASILLLSISVWLQPRPSNPLTLQKAGTFLIPGLSTAGAVVILYAGNFHAVSQVALNLATVTLLLVGVRLVVSVRGMRALSQERHHQSVTDELTGLGNRRCLSTVLDGFFADYDVTAGQQR